MLAVLPGMADWAWSPSKPKSPTLRSSRSWSDVVRHKPVRYADARDRCSPTSPGPVVHGKRESQRQPYDLARWAFRPDLRGMHPTQQPVAGRPYRSGCVAAAYSREWPKALRLATASVLGDALGIAGRQGFPQIRAVRAVWRGFRLDGNACRATGGCMSRQHTDADTAETLAGWFGFCVAPLIALPSWFQP